jgi:TDG/mug DNA glycosylase family protein
MFEPSLLERSQIIEDVLQPNLRLVFCGTALGRTSAAVKAYYAHPRNLFWSVLDDVGFTAAGRPLRPAEYRRVLEFGIGLTDLCKFACGNDNDLRRSAFDSPELLRKIDRYRPKYLAFTSKNAGRVFCGAKAELGWQTPTSMGTQIYILPSTSPAARWQWDANKAHWQNLASAVLSPSS